MLKPYLLLCAFLTVQTQPRKSFFELFFNYCYKLVLPIGGTLKAWPMAPEGVISTNKTSLLNLESSYWYTSTIINPL